MDLMTIEDHSPLFDIMFTLIFLNRTPYVLEVSINYVYRKQILSWKLRTSNYNLQEAREGEEISGYG